MKTRTTALSVAIGLAVGSLTFASTAIADEQPEQAQELQKLKVTGSRISRAEVEGPSPITVVSSEDIQAKGFNSAQDILNSLTQNTGGNLSQTNSFSFTPAAQSVNLRGLGASRTLILIDGRRLPQYPLAQNGSTNFQDIGQIPVAAIERVEVLTDSGSAVYGSDAIGGVVNFIMKKGFDGVSVKGRHGQTTSGGYSADRLDVVAGKDFDSKRVFFVGQFAGNDILKQKDKSWAGDDNSARSALSGYSSYGASFVDASDNITLPSENCKDFLEGDGVARADGKCGFNRASRRTLKPENKQADLMLRGEFDITPDLMATAEARFNHKETNSTFEPGTLKVETDATHSRGEGTYTRRMVEFGNRESNTESRSYGVTVGLDGYVSDYSWDAYASYSEQKVETDNPAIFASIGDAVKNDEIDLLARLSPETVEKYKGKSTKNARTKLYSVNSSLGGDLIELPAGMSSFSVYGEWNRTDYLETIDENTKNGRFEGLGGSSGGGDRDQIGLGVEALVPIIENLEMTLAGRYDHYFDDSSTGGAFTPKVSLAYRPTDTLLLRGSYGLGFRAPDLKRLFGDETKAFGSGFDPVLCKNAGGNGPQDSDSIPECDTQNFDVTSGPNKELEEEESTNINLGLVWEPVEDLGLTLDWYRIKMENVVTAPSYQDVINEPSKYAGAEVKRNSDGEIDNVIYGPVNQASELRSGIDLSVSYSYDTQNYGTFSPKLSVTKIIDAEYRENDGEPLIDETDFLPEYTATLNLGWVMGDYSVNVFGKYRDSMCTGYANRYYFDTCQDAKDAGQQTKVSSMTTWNLTATYAFNEQGKVTLGAINMFDKQPPADPLSDTSPFYADDYDSPLGRQLYVEAEYNF
ncbi:TonB-dependent receptor plug domain-containing protein [Salinivibrio costicola]|uniref:TonB-dependent receptor n=1 Tax=Salinivibrio costicola TaxID=51367 RepID=A0ABX6K470_SALCS|nr:TonB-dependent receptor [Salinivibrio costicola]QIR05026.1 TonB-dependent receptor [Salinivibrio costicola]